MNDVLVNAIADLDEDKVLAVVKDMIQLGDTTLSIIEECQKGVEIVGRRYSEGRYFLSDLVMSESILKDVIEIIEPYLPRSVKKSSGIHIIMGTIEGDIHDLGKNIVIYLLRSAGYRIHDLGVNVPPEKFVNAVKNTGASMVGICMLLSSCVRSVKKVIELLVEAGLRDRVRVVLGGYAVDPYIKDYTGADYFSNDAIEALEIFDRLSGITRVLSK